MASAQFYAKSLHLSYNEIVMKTQTSFTPSDVKHIAQLANIPVSEAEEKELAAGFNSVIAVIDQLNSIDTTNIAPTHQVTGLHNVFREDVVDEARMFTQEEALNSTKNKHAGYFVVTQILEGD